MKTPMQMLITYLEASIVINDDGNSNRNETYSRVAAIAKIYAEHELYLLRTFFDAGHNHAVGKEIGAVDKFPEFDEYIKRYEE
jgi:hypothetical protein